MPGDIDVKDRLAELELRLLDPAVRSQPARAGALLALGFREFGSSGRVWQREETLAALAEEPAGEAGEGIEAIEVSDLRVELLGPECALVTYESRHGARRALRSSVWRLIGDDGWQMVFHQGTRIEQS